MQLGYALVTLTLRSSTKYLYQVLTAMKTETTFHYSNFPLKVAEDKRLAPEKLMLRVVERNDFGNMRFAFIDNKAIHDSTNWDLSWFANYE